MKNQKRILIIMILVITFINIFACNISHASESTYKIDQKLADNESSPNNTSIKTQIQEQSESQEQAESQDQSESLSLYSEAAVMIDSETGKVLFDKNANQKMYPASTTKILTAIIAIEKCNLTDSVTASYNAIMSIPAGYSNAAIQENEVLTVEELLNVFLIHSANEAGMILAEHISGSIANFADLMNEKVLEIGCTNTHFTNPSGIHDVNHYSTAYDMALIAQYCMKNDTFRNIVSKTSCTIAPTNKYDARYFVNTNDLILPSSQYYYKYAIGIKTGYTSQAKNCLIAASSKDNLELITVVLGAQTTETGKSGRNIDTINLFEYGYSNYKFQEIVTQGTIVKEISIDNATKDTEVLPLITKDSISSIVSKNFDLNNLDYSIELNEDLKAPISQGAVIGNITYNIDGNNYSSQLLAEHNVEKSNIQLLVLQIIMVVIILIILVKLLSPNGHSKKKKSNLKRKF